MEDGEDAAAAADPPSITPVTIITGFLGAGKTTLLRHVLTEPHGLKIAVVQNEMSAAVGLEEATVRGPNGEAFAEWMELANGCVCCAVRDDLVQCMEKLVERRSFDYVLIETTGMADPGPVASSFWLDAELESPLKLDGIVTVVDGQNLSKQLGTMEACRQIASADIILLNKTDGLEPDHLAQLQARQKGQKGVPRRGTPHAASAPPPLVTRRAARRRVACTQAHLQHLNSAAPVLKTEHSRVPTASILNLNAFDATARLERVGKAAPEAAAPASIAPWAKPLRGVGRASAGRGAPSGAALCGECDDEAPGPSAIEAPPARLRWLHQDAAFGQVTLVGLGRMAHEALERALAEIFFEPEQLAHERLVLGGAAADAPPLTVPEIYRAKGIFDVAGSGRMYALQAVQSTYELVEGPPWAEAEVRESRVTFIGRDLPSRDALRAILQRAAADSPGTQASSAPSA